jgi:nucleoside-diphosphate-sugar epimerase
MLIGITGGLGVIGQELIKELRTYNIRYKILDNAKRGESFGDICNQDDLNSLFYDCSGIVHLAGISSVNAGEVDADLCYKTNVLGTLSILDFISKFNPPKWLLFVSSREVYGIQRKFPVAEWAKCSPTNQYGMSKILAEDLARSKCQKLKIPFAILRLSNVYGSLSDIPERVIPRFFQDANKDKKIVCFGDTTTCDFIHIQDVLASIIAAITKLQNNDFLQVINICSGEETGLVELAKSIVRLTASKSTVSIQPKSTHHAERFVGSNAKANSILEWSPKIKMPDGLKMFFNSLIKT